jgi:hypothetical protein
MSAFGTTAAHWHMQALEARIMAANLDNSELRADTLKIANQYDQLAERSASSANAPRDSARISDHKRGRRSRRRSNISFIG